MEGEWNEVANPYAGVDDHRRSSCIRVEESIGSVMCSPTLAIS
ncbi:MAG: hypothetical protein M0T85_06980 [Dehalococcoidales bacterium]|nr:hypothetical protein [Dehalococcoidales bacterium]